MATFNLCGSFSLPDWNCCTQPQASPPAQIVRTAADVASTSNAGNGHTHNLRNLRNLKNPRGHRRSSDSTSKTPSTSSVDTSGLSRKEHHAHKQQRHGKVGIGSKKKHKKTKTTSIWRRKRKSKSKHNESSTSPTSPSVSGTEDISESIQGSTESSPSTPTRTHAQHRRHSRHETIRIHPHTQPHLNPVDSDGRFASIGLAESTGSESVGSMKITNSPGSSSAKSDATIFFTPVVTPIASNYGIATVDHKRTSRTSRRHGLLRRIFWPRKAKQTKQTAHSAKHVKASDTPSVVKWMRSNKLTNRIPAMSQQDGFIVVDSCAQIVSISGTYLDVLVGCNARALSGITLGAIHGSIESLSVSAFLDIIHRLWTMCQTQKASVVVTCDMQSGRKCTFVGIPTAHSAIAITGNTRDNINTRDGRDTKVTRDVTSLALRHDDKSTGVCVLIHVAYVD